MTTNTHARGVHGWVPPGKFGTRIWQVRRHLGMSVAEFAGMIGQQPTQVSRWEHGARPRNLPEVCRRINAVTGVDLFWLLYGDSPDGGDPQSSSDERHAEGLRGGRNNVTYRGHSLSL